MSDGVAIPLHLAVHVLGFTVAVGLAAHGLIRRRGAGAAWPGLVVAGALLAVAHVASGALLAGELAWPVYLRAAAYAGIAVAAAGRLVGATVLVALAPPGAHIAAAIAGGAAAVAAARGVLGRGRIVLPLAAGLGLWGASDLVMRADATVAGLLSIAGSAAVGGWLLGRGSRSLLTQLFGAFLGVLLLLVVGLASTSGVIFSVDLQREQLASLDELAGARAQQFTEDWPRELRRVAAPLVGDRLAQELTRAATAGVNLDGRAASIAAFPGVDVAVLLTLDGQVVGSSDPLGTGGPLPAADEATLAGAEVLAPSFQGAETTGVLAFGQEQILAVGAVPVAPRQGGEPQLDRQAGVLVLGRRVADPRVVAEIEQRTGAEATILVSGNDAASSLGTEASTAIADAVRRGTTSGIETVAGERRFVNAAPIVADDGRTLGQVVLSLDATSLADVEENVTRTLFLAAIVGVAAAGVLSWLVSSRTVRPVRRLTEAAEQIAAGDYDVRLETDRGDEVGRLTSAFDGMATSLGEREEALRLAAVTEADLRQRLEVVTASMGEALVAVDRDGRVTTANPAAAELIGRDARKLVGRDLGRVLQGRDLTGEPLADALGHPTSSEPVAVRGAIGSGRRGTPVSATAAPLVDGSGEVLGRVLVLRDISGEVEVERMKTEFLSNISHELRTPLTPIKGYAEVLRFRDVDRERTREFAGNISSAALRLERIIGMLVDFAALEAGRMQVQLVPTDVSEVVDDVLAHWREARPERRFVRRISRGLDDVLVDPNLLNRVLEELIDNAVKFSDDAISILGREGDRGRVELVVRDRGQGISEEELEVILRDFHQADGSATRRFGGLGLGLSIVSRILDRFNADIEIESSVDDGTDVIVRLPVVER